MRDNDSSGSRETAAEIAAKAAVKAAAKVWLQHVR
jgi:hypothetical protein